MKNTTMGKANFIIDHILCVNIVWTVYKSYIFRSLPGLTNPVSMLILFGLVILCCCIGIFQNKRPRCYHRLVLDVVAGFGLYTIPAYISVVPKVMIIAAGIAVVCSIAQIIMTACLKIANRSKVTRKQIIVYKARRVLGGTASIICICLAAIMIFIGVFSLLGKPLADPSTRIAKQVDLQEQTIENNIDTLVKLEEENWKTLSIEQKLEVLQKVADIEQRYLGLPAKLTVKAGNLERPVVGSYSNSKRVITVDKEYLRDAAAEKLINTVTHEAYHSLQHCMVEVYENADPNNQKLLFFSDARTYAKEFNNYISSHDNPEEYRLQLCEINAKKYAETATEEYLKKIYDYIQAGLVGNGQ